MSSQPSDLPDHPPTVVMLKPYPLVECGRYPVKRIAGEPLPVSLDLFKDGHDIITAVVQWRKVGDKTWNEVPLVKGDNERWHATLVFPEPGRFEYTFLAWPDRFRSWKHYFDAKWKAKSDDLPIEVLEGAVILEKTAAQALAGGDTDTAEQLHKCSETMRQLPPHLLAELILSEELQTIVEAWPDRDLATRWPGTIPVLVDRERARFSSWYEFFPRGAEGRADKHSRFRDCVERLAYAADMGFDTIYFPPIHPIGITHRKGKNNSLVANPDDVGSPWAIGGKEGGHRDIHPDLGTVEDFVWLLGKARELGLEIALDFAIQCSPDHPWAKEHRDWFHVRPDGSIRYAENPPKKYQDIYPIHFHGPDWKQLWEELTDTILLWVSRGVRIFRVDNPHTKPVAFWEYLIRRVHEVDPNVIFLAEAFTKPGMMQALGMVGFAQSYTYFTWRETTRDFHEYLTELTQGEMKWYYRGNFWPNTPDILPGHLQNAPASSFRIRAALAALMMPSWGIYSGFEFCENEPYPGKEEYNNNEKYQLVNRDYSRPGLRGFIRELNRLRRENRALQIYDNLRFTHSPNEQILAFLKVTEDLSNRLLILINLDHAKKHETTVHLDLESLGIDPARPYLMHDLLHGNTYEWKGRENYVALDPAGVFLHVFRVDQKPV
jgi:starch synthase (maltosyl-transferring)